MCMMSMASFCQSFGLPREEGHLMRSAVRDVHTDVEECDLSEYAGFSLFERVLFAAKSRWGFDNRGNRYQLISDEDKGVEIIAIWDKDGNFISATYYCEDRILMVTPDKTVEFIY